jgi:hypothetical protein
MRMKIGFISAQLMDSSRVSASVSFVGVLGMFVLAMRIFVDRQQNKEIALQVKLHLVDFATVAGYSQRAVWRKDTGQL